jgi:hypothetical protein
VTTPADKRAALALHGLSAEDREWVLSQLTTSEREAVSGHLDELESLGFPHEVSDIVGEALADRQPVNRIPEVDIIDAAAPKIVHRVLKHEQPSTLALIMEYHPWRWQKRVMRALGRARSRAVQAAMTQRRFAASDAVQRAVMSSLAAAITTASSGDAPVNGFDSWRVFR